MLKNKKEDFSDIAMRQPSPKGVDPVFFRKPNCFDVFQMLTHADIATPTIQAGDAACSLQGEQMFGMMPLCFATYPAIALRLPKCDEKRLKQSLSRGAVGR